MKKRPNHIHNGYVYIYQPKHSFCTSVGYVMRSRFTMEQHLGRYLTKKEIVHHKGIKYPLDSIENKQDDRIENLNLCSGRKEHSFYHIPKNKGKSIQTNTGKTHFKKGHIPWNKGTKGVMKVNSGSFKKGHKKHI